MGYACPVCAREQADDVHLANHLAVTASLGREDHLEWLSAHAPDWADCTQRELAERVREYAPEVETPEFESEDHAHGHADDRGRPFEDELARQAQGMGRGSMTARGGTDGALSADTEAVLEEARELTRRMYEDDGDEDENA